MYINRITGKHTQINKEILYKLVKHITHNNVNRNCNQKHHPGIHIKNLSSLAVHYLSTWKPITLKRDKCISAFINQKSILNK